MCILQPIHTCYRWIRNPCLRRFEWQNHAAYWRFKRITDRMRFRCHRQLFQTKSELRELGETSSAFFGVLRAIRAQALVALVAVSTLVVLDRFLPLPTPRLLGIAVKPESVLTLMSTLAQISATLLGLYFAAVSLVASTSYNRVSGEVRALVVGEEVGSFYFGFLAQFAGLTIYLTVCHAMGLTLGLWSIIAAMFVGIFGVFSFVVLGLRTFTFFDPATLTNALNRSLVRCIHDATPEGYRWQDPSFQNYHQKHALVILHCYGSLVTLAQPAEDLNGSALPGLARGLVSILRYYAGMKSQIPSESQWFRRRPRHKDWFTDSHTELEVARATDTALPPEMVPDHGWFEQEAALVLGRIARGLLERTDLNPAATFLTEIHEYLETLGRQFQLREAIELSHSLEHEIDKKFAVSCFEQTPPAALERSALRMALYDLQGLGLISILLGLAKTLRKKEPSATAECVTNIKWTSPASLYRTGARPRSVLEQWEGLHKSLDFEITVEGDVVSPRWVALEVTAFGYAQTLTALPDLLTACEHFFGAGVNARIGAKDLVGAAQIGLRAMEATHKYNAHFAAARKWHEATAKMNRSHDRPWPMVDWDDCFRRITALRKSVVANLARCVPALSTLPESKWLPDLFGQVYSVLADACFTALLQEDETAFSQLFPVFFETALSAHDRIFQRKKGQVLGLFKLAMGPCGDLLAISGYALLTTELNGKSFGRTATAQWDVYFKHVEDEAKARALIERFADSTDVLAGMSPRELLRYQWANAYNDYLAEKGFVIGHGLYAADIPNSPHPSVILRAYAVRSDMLCDAEDVFLALYLFKRPEAMGLKMPHQVESFRHGVEVENTTEGDA